MGRMNQSASRRERRVTQVAIDTLRALDGAMTLVAEDQLFADRLQARLWSRWSEKTRLGEAYPPEGSYEAATLRLPKSRKSFEMASHFLARSLSSDGALYIYGANDEGIRSAHKKLALIYEHIETIATRRKCRVLRASDPIISELRTQLDDWAEIQTIEIKGVKQSWVSYPGLFAKGKLDEATAMLLEELSIKGTVLDFACGTGVSTKGLVQCGADKVDALDADALAVLATRHNVPEANVYLGDGWQAVKERGLWDTIVSNPPIHKGFGEDYEVLRSLIHHAPRRTRRLIIVVQRQIPVKKYLEKSFRKVNILRENSRFRVWEASKGR